MAIEYLAKEVERVQRNFNASYQGLTIIDLQARRAIIFGIIHMDLLTRSIKKAETDFDHQFIIKKFIRIRNKINRSLSLIKKGKERRSYGDINGNGYQRQANDGTGNAR